jgi:hypothetical protein
VYEWLRELQLPGGVVEWPIGFPYDCEYTLRQAEHGKPLVNGHTSFLPKPYEEVVGVANRRPIPSEIWSALGKLEAALVIYHSHETRGVALGAYGEEVERALASGGLEVVRSFPHEGGQDFVLIAAGAPWRDRLIAGQTSPASETRDLFDRTLVQMRGRLARANPPFGVLHLPGEDQVVSPGFWAFGWALDDTGIAEIRTSTELGPVGVAQLGGPWPKLSELYPAYPESQHGGYGFPIPDLPPGPHTLRVTFVARDGGRFDLTRRFIVEKGRTDSSR